jgi:hypothetical protein
MSARRQTAAGATYGNAPHPASLVAVASQPEMDTQVGDMEGPQWQGVLCVQPYWITCGWLISRRCSNLRAIPWGTRVVSKCLLIQGCPAEYLALLPSHTARVITVQGASSARWFCNRIRKWALSVRTCIRACTVVVHKAIPWLPLCTGCCSVPPWRRTLPVQDKDFGQSMDWDPGCPGAVHSVTGGKISHHGRPRFCIGTRSQRPLAEFFG